MFEHSKEKYGGKYAYYIGACDCVTYKTILNLDPYDIEMETINLVYFFRIKNRAFFKRISSPFLDGW